MGELAEPGADRRAGPVREIWTMSCVRSRFLTILASSLFHRKPDSPTTRSLRYFLC